MSMDAISIGPGVSGTSPNGARGILLDFNFAHDMHFLIKFSTSLDINDQK